MSWPFGSAECPRCRYFERLDPPAEDDAGYEIVGLCSHPRIAGELFRFKERQVTGGCPCFTLERSASRSRRRNQRPNIGPGTS
jgi:hypothetical protein